MFYNTNRPHNNSQVQTKVKYGDRLSGKTKCSQMLFVLNIVGILF